MGYDRIEGALRDGRRVYGWYQRNADVYQPEVFFDAEERNEAFHNGKMGQWDAPCLSATDEERVALGCDVQPAWYVEWDGRVLDGDDGMAYKVCLAHMCWAHPLAPFEEQYEYETRRA